MASLVNINKDFSTSVNFWELNPQLIFMPPFNKLYQLDGGEMYSSKLMWTVFFICDPDEDVNKFFKFGEKKIQEMLNETYFGSEPVEWDTDFLGREAFQECVEAYPNMCLTAVQQAFMMKKKALLKRAKYLDEAEYNGGTMRDLDNAHAKTGKILEDYEKAEEKFFAEKKQARVKGGRKQSKGETREI